MESGSELHGWRLRVTPTAFAQTGDGYTPGA